MAVFAIAADEDGDVMVQCESCLVWQHIHCMGIAEKDIDSMTYYCELCRPDLHPNLAAAKAAAQ